MPICSTAGLLYLRLRPRLKCVGPSCHHVERGQPLHPIYATAWNSFHRGGCQETLLPPPGCSCIRRRHSQSAVRCVGLVSPAPLVVLIVRLCALDVQQLRRSASMYVLRSETGTILPYPQDDRGDPSGDRQLGQIGLRSRRSQLYVVLVQGIGVQSHHDRRGCEPPRVCRRLHSLRGWGHGKTKQVFTGGSREGGPDGLGAPRGSRL